MINTVDNSGLLLGNNTLDHLKLSAKQNSPDALKKVAKQFEALFMNMMTKSMRSGTGEGALDNSETRLYTELLDQQYSQTISAGKGLGLADALVQQLTRNQVSPLEAAATPNIPLPIHADLAPKAFKLSLPGSAQTPLPITPNNQVTIKPLSASPNSAPPSSAPPSAAPSSPKEFVERFLPHAQAAGRELGVNPQAILAQAALESGWGKHQIKLADGSPSHNLFGIKASSNWHGKVAEVRTTEFVNGVAQKKVERFRAYDSDKAAFRDYAGLLKSAPRYHAVLNTGKTADFAQGLQKAGYATDPNYAAKIARVAQNRSISALA